MLRKLSSHKMKTSDEDFILNESTYGTPVRTGNVIIVTPDVEGSISSTPQGPWKRGSVSRPLTNLVSTNLSPEIQVLNTKWEFSYFIKLFHYLFILSQGGASPCKSSLLFRDCIRSIDFVLVWDKFQPKALESATVGKRKVMFIITQLCCFYVNRKCSMLVPLLINIFFRCLKRIS